MKRPLKFFDIAVGKSFTTAEYQVVEVAFRFPHGVERRPMSKPTKGKVHKTANSQTAAFNSAK